MSSSPTAEAAATADPAAEQVARTIDFLVIGAQKAGTTWLHDAFDVHPDMFVPREKELHFFSRNDRFEQGYASYLEHFEGSDDAAAVGECTPNYFYTMCTPEEHRDWIHRDVPGRVKTVLPNVKLILSLRDPVKRAVSAYYHLMQRGVIAPNKTLRDVQGRHGITSIGRYAAHMEAWLKHFPRDQFKVLIYESDIAPDEKKLETINDVFGFLGVSPWTDPQPLYARTNARGGAVIAHFNQFKVFRETAFGRRIAKGVDRRAPAALQRMARPQVSQADLDALQDTFARANADLATLIGRPLPW